MSDQKMCEEKVSRIIPAEVAWKMTFHGDGMEMARAVVNQHINDACSEKQTRCEIDEAELPCFAIGQLIEELKELGYKVNRNFRPMESLIQISWRY